MCGIKINATRLGINDWVVERSGKIYKVADHIDVREVTELVTHKEAFKIVQSNCTGLALPDIPYTITPSDIISINDVKDL